ncbi:MAG: PEGA domain-containing protein [Deltaproteobacteria bacterium]|nr:PEGA domain-containing protein [Deltaproteobacteria bacterium]
MRNLLLILLALFLATACGGRGRVLVVKSEPADAEVCIKGKAKSEHFSNRKSCVGTTPFEADRVDVLDDGGEKRTVKFKDVEGDKESFYVVVGRNGYASQAIEVPAWEHMVVLKPEGAAAPAPAPVIPPPPVAPIPSQPAAQGSVKISSEPVGALVYLNDSLKGNTPFTYQGAAGTVRLKLELEGYAPLEKVITVEADNAIKVSFKLQSAKAAAAEEKKSRPVESEPVKAKEPVEAPAPAPAATPAPK